MSTSGLNLRSQQGFRADSPERIAELLAAPEEYRLARERLLSVLGPRMSNRDPLAEFAEHFVAALMGGRLAVSPVQAYWDIELADDAKVQVKYLVNSADSNSKAWVNEHLVRSLPGVDRYALVIIEGFKVSGVAAFPSVLGPVCQALNKRHGDQDTTLQFGRRNWLTIRDHPGSAPSGCACGYLRSLSRGRRPHLAVAFPDHPSGAVLVQDVHDLCEIQSLGRSVDWDLWIGTRQARTLNPTD